MSTQSEAIFNNLVTMASEQRASDLFLFPGRVPFIRKDGEIIPLLKERVVANSFVEEMIVSLLDQNQQKKFHEQQQIVFSCEIIKGQRARVNIFRQTGLPVISIKLIPNFINNLESLKLPKVVTDLASLNQGLVIVSGSKDSGRSSLTASMVDYINRDFSKYIATIEHPIEQIFTGGKSLIEQREIGRDVLNLSDEFESIKDRNVDVLAVSEIDDLTTILDLLQIAQKGVLVFLALDIDSVFNVVKQIIESFEPEKQNFIRVLFGENLGGIICTHLVTRRGGGRVLALEILYGSPVSKTIIKEGKLAQIQNILQVTEQEMSISLDRFLANLVKANEITLEEAVKHCTSEDNIRTFLKG